MQLNDDRLCYNVHKSSKMFQKLTYLYLDNLKKNNGSRIILYTLLYEKENFI